MLTRKDVALRVVEAALSVRLPVFVGFVCKVNMTFDELKAHHRQNEQEYLMRIQQQKNEVISPSKPAPQLNKPALEAPVTTPIPPVNQPKVAMPEQTVTPTEPQFDERNREYQIRRAALGDNPTKEEMDAVRDFGLEQHRKHFPNLYA